MKKSISIVIPVYNNPSGLRVTLNSLVKQTIKDLNYEIIVVDNGSIDDTFNVAEEFRKKYPKLVRVRSEIEVQSSYAARNKGIDSATGEIIVFIDADMIAKDDYLGMINSVFNERSCDVICSNVKIEVAKPTIFALYNKMLGFPIKEYIKEKNFCPTCCLSIRKNILKKVGYFDTRLISGGDREFSYRIKEKGYKIYYDQDITLLHPARFTVKGFLNKGFRVGRGIAQITRYYPELCRSMRRKIFNPYYFLPCNPLGFPETLKDNEIWKSSTLFLKFGFYFLCWLKKLINHSGYIYERKINV